MIMGLKICGLRVSTCGLHTLAHDFEPGPLVVTGKASSPEILLRLDSANSFNLLSNIPQGFSQGVDVDVLRV